MLKKIAGLVPVVLILLLMSVTAFAAETWLFGIDGMRSPHGVAVAPNGNILVTSPVWNTVQVMDSKGIRIRQVQIQHPSAIAVDAAGRIFIGTGKYSTDMPPYSVLGEVKVYDSSFNYLSSLGSGAGEFIAPSSIAVGADGSIYVADAEANKVKIFNADGSLRLSFGTFGIGDTFFNKPAAVAVDEATGNIYVADRQLSASSGGGYASGARVQAFDAQGQYIAGMGTYGQLLSPSGLAVSNGKVYVADSYQDLIYVYGTNGSLITSFSSPGNTVRVPGSLVVSADNLLYVTGSNSGNLNVFGLDDHLYFDVTPRTLNLVAFEGGAQPSAQNVVINNSGTGALQWTAGGTGSWLLLGKASGELAAGQSDALPVSVDQSGLAVGDYQGRVDVISQNGTTVSVAVLLTVKPRPVLSVSPSSLTFTASAGSPEVLSQQISVSLTNAAAGSVWNAGSDAAWLGINPVQSGAATADVTVSAANLVAGHYTAQISVGAADAVGSPATVSVDLTVITTGSISVTSNIDEAAFTVSGDNGVVYNGSGKDWRTFDVQDGTYTITFQPVAGFKKPADQTAVLSLNRTVKFNGTYRNLGGANQLIVSVGGADMGGTVGVFTAAGDKLAEFTPFGPDYRGTLNVASGDIDGDGFDDIIVGSGKKNIGVSVGVFDSDGLLKPNASINARSLNCGVNVAAGDLDGDGRSELIVGSGQDCRSGSTVTIYKYVNGSLVKAGASVKTFNTPKGVNMASADVNGDGRDDVIVAPGPYPTAPAVVRVLSVDISGGVGKWTLAEAGAALRVFDGGFGANIAAADLDGDGIAEILAASGSHAASENNRLVAFNGDGSPQGIDITFETSGGIEVAAADTDLDGKAEIFAAPGGGRRDNPSSVLVYRSDGSAAGGFTAYPNSQNGSKIALGKIY
ncbi:MAG: FG-GAP-like repeat-containing protein [Thermodesulfovibrionales bacterium]